MRRLSRSVLALVVASGVVTSLVGIVGAEAASAAPSAPTDPICVGGDASGLDAYRAALAKVGTEPVDVLAIGDSVTEGWGASSDSTRWLDLLRGKLQSAYNPGGSPAGVGYVPAWHVTGNPNGWTWGSPSGGWSPTWVSTGFGLGERAALLDAAGRYGNVSFTGDRFWLLYTQRPVGPPLVVTIDGGPPTTIETAAPTRVSGRTWDSGPLGRGTHLVRVAAAAPVTGGASAVVDGLMAFDGDGGGVPNSGNGVRMWDGGRSGATAPLFLTKPAIGFDANDTIDPDLILIGLGANDIVAAVSAEQHKANLAAMIDRYRAGSPAAPHASIAIWIEPTRADVPATTYQPYVDAMHALGVEKGVAVIDIHRRLAQGGDPAFFTDTIHLNDAGNAVVADAFAEALIDGRPCATTTGTVRTAAGLASGGSCVTAWQVGASDPTAVATVAPDGTFALPDLNPDAGYQLQVTDCGGSGVVPEWWQDATDRAASAVVAAGSTGIAMTVDVAVAQGTAITGTVVSDAGTAVAGLCVYAFPAGTSTGVMVKTAADGSFAVLDLTGGAPYQIGFYDCSAAGYEAEWWQDAATQATSTIVTPGVRIDAVVSLAPTAITGTVTSDAGAVLGGICVDAFANGATTVGATTRSNPDGTFSLAGLSPYPTYQLRFSDCTADAYSTEWWKDATTQAVAVSVTTGAVVNPALARKSVATTITGRARTAQGAALAGICVYASPVGATSSTMVKTAADGTFTVAGLSATTGYQVQFVDCAGRGYATEWWQDAATRATSTPVAPGAALDATLGLAPTTITGKVTDGTGTALRNMCVAVYVSGAKSVTKSVKSAADGTFTVTGLSAAATYQVRFTDCTRRPVYATEWWKDAPTQAAAMPITTGTHVTPVLARPV